MRDGPPPEPFGKYELLELLGEGGMARVYRAIQAGPMGFRKEVALKQLRPRKEKQQKRVRAFINEARLGGHLRHRNLVEVYEFGQEGDVFYIAMEFVRGPSLDDVLKRVPERGPLPIRIVVQIALQMCAGLHYAHGARDLDGNPLHLVHRDLKPANVMITRDATVKIADFGIAKATSNIDRTTSGVAKGTPLFMSPEQVMGSNLDHRSDLFSLGALTTQLITGQFVFNGKRLDEIVQRVARADVGEALTLAQLRAPTLVPVLRDALERKPDDRPRDAREFGTRLRSAYKKLEGKERLRPWLHDWFPPAAGDVHDQSQFSIGGHSTSLSAARDAAPPVEALQVPPPLSPEIPPAGATESDIPPPVLPRPGARDDRGPGWGLVAALAVPLVLLLLVLGVLGGGAWFGKGDAGGPKPAPTGEPVAQLESEIEVESESEIETETEIETESETETEIETEIETVTATPHEPPPTTPVDVRPATLSVNVKEGWAEVFVDQKPVGQTPIHRLELAPGSHEVWLHNPETLHEDFETFQAAPGGVYRITGELKPPF